MRRRCKSCAPCILCFLSAISHFNIASWGCTVTMDNFFSPLKTTPFTPPPIMLWRQAATRADKHSPGRHSAAPAEPRPRHILVSHALDVPPRLPQNRTAANGAAQGPSAVSGAGKEGVRRLYSAGMFLLLKCEMLQQWSFSFARSYIVFSGPPPSRARQLEPVACQAPS
jgi:hypothetical protein